MRRHRPTLIFVVTCLIGFIFNAGCEDQFAGVDGFLEGTISIGPICPVERYPPDPGCLPTGETYKAYPVRVYTSNGKREITLLSPSLDGKYRAELAPGKYLVILDNPQNRIGSSNLPVEVTIFSGSYTSLDINIDTGIR